MTVRKLTFAFLFALVSFAMNAQDAAAPAYRSFTPKDQWEIGLDLGSAFVTGDLNAKPGFGGGLHVRKAFDHVFSVRGNFLFASASSESKASTGNPYNRKSSLTWISGDAQAVMTLNNLRFNKPNRKVLVNIFGGAGFNNYSTEYSNILRADGSRPTTNTSQDATTNLHLSFGAGLAYRISPKLNIGLEYTIYKVIGDKADLLDSDENVNQSTTSYGDLLHFPHLQLNFNIGKSKDGSKISEPLYWANPLSEVSDAITKLEARPVYDPTDTDADGIIDAIDDEDNSPAGARVNTKGVTLDSDGDKVPDYQDKEPFSPPGYKVDGMGVAQVPKPISEADVNRIVDAKLANFKLPAPKVTEWFLPIVNFKDNSYGIEYTEYEKLYQIATVLKQNPDVKLVAIGGTDKRSSEKYNNVLSYNRAKAAIEFLVAQHGIARDRLVLNWVGENSSLVPVDGANLQNRRVEFRVAKGETEMARPEGPEAGKAPKKGSFKGNKDAGY
ncbi:MAG: OmpA family protein [Bacteroidetes bacterium]|nr:OmpA family protein [Bacteroidota bacterium]